MTMDSGTKSGVSTLRRILGAEQTSESFDTALRRILFPRLRTISAVIALFAVLWIPADLYTLEQSAAVKLIFWRVLFACSVLVIFFADFSGRGSFWRLFMLFASQAFFFLMMELAVSPENTSLMQLGYRLFPFFVVVQIAIFPLSIWRAVLCATPVFVSMLISIWASDATLSNRDFLDIWLFSLISGVAMWASVNQLILLQDLLQWRSDASHDALTGLENRRSLEAFLLRLIADLDRQGALSAAASVLVLDIDHFKKVNDQYGHDGGDKVLTAVAQILQRSLRTGDIAARFGGEEFLIVLPRATKEVAATIAERVRLAIAENKFDVGIDSPINITISIGVAQFQPGNSMTDWFKHADEALYSAKQQGRNRVICA